MRKIRPWIVTNYLTAEPVLKLIVKNQDGNLIDNINSGTLTPLKSKYTPEELNSIKIEMCNRSLKERNMNEMTEEEIKYMLTPKIEKDDNLTVEEFQKLAGIIIY